MQRQIQKNNGTLLHKKVIARKMGCKSVEEYNLSLIHISVNNLKDSEDEELHLLMVDDHIPAGAKLY